MGMYTEIYINTDLRKDTPNEVIYVLKAIKDKDMHSPCLADKPERWFLLFNNGSYYTPSTECCAVTYDAISEQWSLLGKGDLKNYGDEIMDFFLWIAPYCEPGFIGYYRYEEDLIPTLVFRTEDGEIAIHTPEEANINNCGSI